MLLSYNPSKENKASMFFQSDPYFTKSNVLFTDKVHSRQHTSTCLKKKGGGVGIGDYMLYIILMY